MLEIKRIIKDTSVELIKVKYEFLKDEKCVKVLDSAIKDLTKNKFCWSDIFKGLSDKQHQFGESNKVGEIFICVDYHYTELYIQILKPEYIYYLQK